MAKTIVKNLFLKALPHYDRYPIERKASGGVSGSLVQTENNWRLSSDIGCAFICIDGLSRYYALTKDPAVFAFIEKTAALFMAVDKIGGKVQTHATLTAARGMFCFFQATGNRTYYDFAKNLFDLYRENGMTLTYENFNWFTREDTWTEPCAVVDSLILALSFYNETHGPMYRTLARRIAFNGLSFCHRENGGACPNTCVTQTQPYLSVSMYEAAFCCTIRYNEGLLWMKRNKDLFAFDAEATMFTDEIGRTYVDDVLLVTDESGKMHLLPDLAFAANTAEQFLIVRKDT